MFDTELTEGTETREFVMNDSSRVNVHSSETLIDLDKFGMEDDVHFGRRESVVFNGNVDINNCVTEGEYILHIVPRVKLNDNDTIVKVNNNTIQRADTAGLRAIVRCESEITISGMLYIDNNTFDMSSVPANCINAGLYYDVPSSVMYFADGGLNVEENRTNIANTRFRQIHFAYDLSKTTGGASITNKELEAKSDVTPLFLVKDGYKFKASESIINIYAYDKSGMYYEQCIMATWSNLTVENLGATEHSQIINTFFKDDEHYYDAEDIMIREIYKKQKGIVEKVMMGRDYIEVAAVLLERLPGTTEENMHNTRIATVSYQMIARDIYTQIEKPMGKDYYYWNDGTRFEKNLEEGVFWVGPNRNYLVEGDINEGAYQVFDKDFVVAIATTHYVDIDHNFYLRAVNGMKIRKGIYIYGYEVDLHEHEAYADIINNHKKTYWVEARNESHLSIAEAEIFLKKDIHVTRPLATDIDGDYSICLNGHSLIFDDIEDFIEFNSNSRVVITNCHNDGTTSGGYIGSNGTLSHSIFDVGEHSGQIIFSSISFIGVDTKVPFVNVNNAGVRKKLITNNVTLDGNSINSSEDKGFINIYQSAGSKFAYLMDGTMINRLIRQVSSIDVKSSHNPNLIEEGKIEEIKWSKTTPSSILMSNIAVYDVSISGNGQPVTDLSNITNDQILAWWDEGYATIYLYSKADYIKMNSNMNEAFSKLKALRKIDMSRFDFSETVFMNEMFMGDESLKSIDLSRMNISNTSESNRRDMFKWCDNLQADDIDSYNDSFTFNLTGENSLYNAYATISDVTLKDNVANGKGSVIAIHDIKTGFIKDCDIKDNKNLMYVSKATLSIVDSKITGTTGAYIYDYDEN